jgi:NAD(P)-dependent dehydrogenase (short-subunit alcohol dehydrogenase family)
MKLDNKVVVITGAGSGIGRTTAALFASKGAKVAIVDVDSEVGAETVHMIKGDGGEASLILADVSKASDVQKWSNEFLALHLFILADCLRRHKVLENGALGFWFANQLRDVFIKQENTGDTQHQRDYRNHTPCHKNDQRVIGKVI